MVGQWACLLLPLIDLGWNLTHLNVGLVDFMGVAGFARGWAENGAWPATPYFPAGYPLLLAPFGHLAELTGVGGVLQGGYILASFGGCLLLAGIWRLARHWGLGTWWGTAAVALMWLSPELRVTAGAPAPDLLATGAGACFMALACETWDLDVRDRRRAIPMALAAGASVFLRYHMLLLALPVAVVLAARRPTRAAGVAVLGSIALVLLINHGAYWLQFHAHLPGAAMLQVRTGLSFRYARPYTSPRDLFNNYPEFVQHSHVTPLLAEYSPAEIARHLALDWMQYLRRPGVATGICLAGLAFTLRRRLAGSQRLALIWLLLFTLSLSPAYYVPRAAVLPVAIGVLLALSAAGVVLPRRGKECQFLAAALLLCGYVAASRFALSDYRLRYMASKASEAVGALAKREGLDWETMGHFSAYVYRIEGNPWFDRGILLHTTWLDDPDIRQVQYPDRRRANMEEVASRADPTVDCVVTFDPVYDTARWRSLASQKWNVLAEIWGAEVWVPKEP